MALQKSLSTNHGIELGNAYIRIDELSGNKNNVNLRVRTYASIEKCQSGCEWIQERIHDFTPTIEDGAPNFLKQGYEHIKTLPEYVNTIDV